MRPKSSISEASCAQNAPGRSTVRPPEALLTRNPTWESSHFSGLSNRENQNAHEMGHGSLGLFSLVLFLGHTKPSSKVASDMIPLSFVTRAVILTGVSEPSDAQKREKKKRPQNGGLQKSPRKYPRESKKMSQNV